MFLTPEFGPRQRFAFILTDAPLEPDPLFEGKICDRCMLCVKDCPGNAISKTETIKVKVAGREIEWGKLDEWGCYGYYSGANREMNPFLPPDTFKDLPDGDKIICGEKQLTPEESPKVLEILQQYYKPIAGYGPTICGGRGCIRACMVHLEERGILKNKFKNPFRKRKPWKLK